MAKISIVLPTYNGSKWVANAIQSILNQEEKDWELIVVNDASTDDTLSIVEGFANQDPRIIVVTNQTNKKLPASLNIGFNLARGKYLTWTSDDNVFKPNAIGLMSSYLDSNPNLDLVSLKYDLINSNGEILPVPYKVPHFQPESLLLYDNVGAAFMYTRSIQDRIGGYNEELFCVEDYEYWLRIALAGNIGFFEDNVYQYRVHSASFTATKKERVRLLTMKVKKRFASQFFERYAYSFLDRSRFWATFPIREIPGFYVLPSSFFKVYSSLLRMAVGILFAFSGSQKRKEIRRRFSFLNGFSFFNKHC